MQSRNSQSVICHRAHIIIMLGDTFYELTHYREKAGRWCLHENTVTKALSAVDTDDQLEMKTTLTTLTDY